MENTENEQREKEYLIQLFGFDPSTLVDEVLENSIEVHTQLLDQLKEKIKKLSDNNREAIDKGIDALKQKNELLMEKKFKGLAVYLDQQVFKIPQHVLLEEDAPWDNLTQSVANTKLTALYTEIAKMRDEYSNCLYMETVLRKHLKELQQICIMQEKTIQKEVSLKEKFGLVGGVETDHSLTQQTKRLNSKLSTISRLSSGKRKVDTIKLSKEKRQKLACDLRNKVDMLKAKLIQ